MGTAEPQVATGAEAQLTDGFQLVIDALKLNGIDTIYGLPGIPITDLTRRAQADGMRTIPSARALLLLPLAGEDAPHAVRGS